MTSFEIRKKFLDFFKKQEHKEVPSASLIPNNDSSLLFVNAGMNQFKEVFLGLNNPPAKNVITIQKCLRAGGKHNDLEMVGETPRHHTFFEMMGNFSFGGYFKEKACSLAWDFLTKELGLNPEHLWVSVHKKDQESFKIWRDQQKIPEHKIFQFGDKDNFWQMGETGPCGYCSEIHYYKGESKKPDPSELFEIWNLVFMEFKDSKDSQGKIQRDKLPTPCVDTGMGLERLSALLQNKQSNYHSDLFKDILLALEKDSGQKYDFTEKSQSEQQKAFRVLADHSRAVVFLINEGEPPSNEGRGYVLRRIMRRALYYSQKLHSEKNLLQTGVQQVLSLMKGVYPELEEVKKDIQLWVDREAQKFFESLKEGRQRLEEEMESLSDKFIPAEIIWRLYDTYGFPTDLTKLIAKDKGWKTAEEKEIKKYRDKRVEALKTGVVKIQQKLAPPPSISLIREQMSDLKAKCNNFLKLYDTKEQKEGTSFLKFIQDSIPENWEGTKFTGYETDKEKQVTILFIQKKSYSESKAENSKPASEGLSGKPVVTTSANTVISECLEEGEIGWLVLDKTCFYPEGGGPVGDRGFLKSDTATAQILDTQKIGDFIAHKVEVLEGALCSLAYNIRDIQLKSENSEIQNQSESRKSEMPLKNKNPAVQSESPKQKSSEEFKASNKSQDTNQKENSSPVQNHLYSLEVDKHFREGIKAGHTATHLLNSALRSVLGNHIVQKGSLVEPHSLRFDFSHPQALTKEEKQQVEQKVQQSISAEEDLKVDHKSFDRAKKEGFLYLKGENYSSEVRVVSVGGESSKELCGGIHVQNTREIGRFKIISEGGVQSGVRRITAYTGSLLSEWEHFLVRENLKLREFFKIPLLNDKLRVKNNKAFKQNTETAFEENKTPLWEGSIEKENPFLKWSEEQDKKIKSLRKKLVQLDFTNPEVFKKAHSISQNFKEVKTSFHPLAQQNLELRESLKMPLPHFQEQKIRDSSQTQKKKFVITNEGEGDLLLDWFQAQKQKFEKLFHQWENLQKLGLSKDKLIAQAKDFQWKEQDGKLLVADIPLDDRSILADLSDVLLSKLSSGVVVLLGTGEEAKHPVFVNLSKNFQKTLSAGDILKNKIVPLCQGRGGGKASFAQGSIQDRSAFSKMESTLLKEWKES